MIRYAEETDAEQIIVATEVGMLYRLTKENPGKQFIPVSEQAVCPNMKMHRLETVLDSLEHMRHSIVVPEQIRLQARKPIAKMLEMS